MIPIEQQEQDNDDGTKVVVCDMEKTDVLVIMLD
jgi:hypothetical protein